jgi:FkbM family methyltransferase
MNLSLIQLIHAIPKHSDYYAIDVGAHYGEYAKFLISTGFFCNVVSFEPNPNSYKILLDSVSSIENCLHEGVNSALSDYSGTLDLYCDSDTATASLLRYESSYINHGEIETKAVPVVTLDAFLDDRNCSERLLLLKIDTQGNDLSVIKGSLHTIMKHRPIIQTEFIYISLYAGQCSPADLTAALVALGYEIYSLNNLHISAEGKLAFCDAIFVPKEIEIPLTQVFSCIDDQVSYTTQINTLTQICAERLALIEQLDNHIKLGSQKGILSSIFRKFNSWVQ